MTLPSKGDASMIEDLRLVDMKLMSRKVGKDVGTVATKLRTTAGQCYALKDVFDTLARSLMNCAVCFERIAQDPDGLIEEVATVEGWCDQLQNFRNFLVSEESGDDISPAKNSANSSSVSGRQPGPSDSVLKHANSESCPVEKPELKEAIERDGNTVQPRKIRVRVWDVDGWKDLEFDWLPMMEGVMVGADCVCGVRVSKEVRWDVECCKAECMGCGREVKFEWK